MLLQLRAEVVAIRMALLLEKEQDERLHKSIKISHAAGARVILAVTLTYFSWHSDPPYDFAFPQANGFTLSRMEIDVKCTWRHHWPLAVQRRYR
jgi:hypothetical protein